MVRRRRKVSQASSELDETMVAIRKRYGDGAAHSAREVRIPDRLSTGSFILDFALLGGMPHNRVSMIAGERHSGKTTMSCKLIASAQRQYPDQRCVFIDIEGTFDRVWAEKLGVDLDALWVVPCATGEMAVDSAIAVLTSAETSLVVADSIAALTPMKEIEDSAEDAHVGMQARLVANFVRRTTAALVDERARGHYATLLLLNQFRAKIGGYGDPRTLPGGRALEAATTIQMIIKNKEMKGRSPEGVEAMTHNEHAFTITKNKLNAGPRTGEFILVRQNHETLDEGVVDDAATVLSYAKKFGLYKGGGSAWALAFRDWEIEFGKAAEAIQALQDDDDLYWDLRTTLIRLQAVELGMPDEFIERIV